MKNRLAITVGIAAYNAEKNIQSILRALISQNEQSIIINEIVVYSDESSDETVNKANSIKDTRIKVVSAPHRRGFGIAVQKLLSIAKSPIVVLLNDDIRIKDASFIQKLVTVFNRNINIGMVSGNPQPIEGKKFVEKATLTSFRAYEKFRYEKNNGNNYFTCDGKVLALSRDFINRLKFPKDTRLMGNVDGFLYFCCITEGFLYKHAKNAVAYWKCPSTVSDYIEWTTRNNSEFFLLENYFGPIVKKEYKKPAKALYYLAIESLKNPIGAAFLLLVKLIIFNRTRRALTNVNSTWSTIKTTK